MTYLNIDGSFVLIAQSQLIGATRVRIDLTH